MLGSDRVVPAVDGVRWTCGRVGTHPELNGRDRTRRRAERSAPDDAPVADTSGTFSVAAWVRLDDDRSRTAVSQGGTKRSAFSLGYDRDLNRWAFRQSATDKNRSESSTVASEHPPAVGVWTHLLGVSDAATGEMPLYVDGIEQGTTPRGPSWRSEGGFLLGADTCGKENCRFWSGAIDDVRVWDRVVLDEPVESDERPQTWDLATPLALQGHWRLDESDGTSAADGSDHGLDASLHGDPATVWGTALNDDLFTPAASLNGTDEYISTEGPAIRTDRSYTVAAWGRLESGAADAALVTQNGENGSGFFLGYSSETGRWTFRTPAADGAEPGDPIELSPEATAEIGEWVHLAAVYDYTRKTVTLHIDGRKVDTADLPSTRNAPSHLAIGAADADGTPTAFWNGDLNEVHVYQGVADANALIDIQEGFIPR